MEDTNINRPGVPITEVGATSIEYQQDLIVAKLRGAFSRRLNEISKKSKEKKNSYK